jgi:tRNA 2-thiouridine synthesizing protein A
VPESDPLVDSAAETPLVVAAVDLGDGARCTRCGSPVCGHDVVLSWVLGFKRAPSCSGCLASGLGRARDELVAAVKQHIDRRECWSSGWSRASERERNRGRACEVAAVAAGIAEIRPSASTTPAVPPAGVAATNGAVPSPTAEPLAGSWDAGDLGCGDLVLELRIRLRALQAGALFEVIARDPGAPADLPAWCGLTGHALVTASHPRYLIRRRKE